MEYMENNAAESSGSAENDVTNSDVATHAGSIVVENEETFSEPEPADASQSHNSEEVSEKKDSETCDINQVIVDESYLGRNSKISELIDDYEQAYLSGKKFPPIKLERKTKKIVDGHHRYAALIRINKKCEQGKLNREDLSHIFNGEFIKVQYVHIPEELEPCFFTLGFNTTHGRKVSMDDIKTAVKVQFEKRPGYAVKELSKFLGVSEQTARKYAENVLHERKEKIKEYVIEASKQGKIQEEIEKELHEMFPGASGISQSTISKILSENSTNRKTNKTESTKNEMDLDSNSNEDAPIPTDDENQAEAPVESTPEDSESDSLNIEESDDSKVSENPNFAKCMNVLEDLEETIISRLEFLSSAEVDKILNRLELLAINVENKAVELKLVA